MKTNRSDHDEYYDSTSSNFRRRASTRRASRSRSASRPRREASSSRQRSQNTSLTELIERFWDSFCWVLGLINGTVRYVLSSKSTRIFVVGIMLCAVAICAPVIMDYASVVPRFALEQLRDNGLRYVATTRSARILGFPNPCLMEPEVKDDGLPGDITGVRTIARWEDVGSDLLEARDNFASLSKDIRTQASLIKVQQHQYMNGAELYALARKHQEMHLNAVRIVGKLYTGNRHFQRALIQDIQVAQENLEMRLKHHTRGGFVWHPIVEGWSRWFPSLFSLTPYATVLESLTSFAGDHQPQAKKMSLLSDDVLEALLKVQDVRDEMSLRFGQEYDEWKSRCDVKGRGWFGPRTMIVPGWEDYCQPRDYGNLKELLESETEWLGRIARLTEAQQEGYSKLSNHYNDVSERLRHLMEKARHGTVAVRLQHSSYLINRVWEDLLATKQTINERLNQETNEHKRKPIPIVQR